MSKIKYPPKNIILVNIHIKTTLPYTFWYSFTFSFIYLILLTHSNILSNKKILFPHRIPAGGGHFISFNQKSPISVLFFLSFRDSPTYVCFTAKLYILKNSIN